MWRLAGVQELFIFEFFCSFTTWSCITLCVDFKWLNKLVEFPLRCRHGQVTSCTITLFVPSQTPQNWSVSTPQNSLYLSSRPKAVFLPSSSCLLLHVFSKHAMAIRTGMAESENLQAGVGRSAQVEMEGFAAFTTQDMACCRMIILLWLSCFHDWKPTLKSKLKFN